MNKSVCLGTILICALLVGGCTPEMYKRSADLQVEKLVADRQKQTLGYTPQVEAETVTPAATSKKSYSKLPATPIPPPIAPPLAPSVSALEYGKLGPTEMFSSGVNLGRQPLSIEEAQRPAIERLRLGPPVEPDDAATFDLFQSIEYAVQHSRDYQARMEDLYLAALTVTLERHLYSPRPFARTGVTVTRDNEDVGYRSALSVTNSAGIRQRLPYGGEIVAQGLFNFVDSLHGNVSDGESAELALTGTIPLLRGAGMINLEPMIQTERELVYEVRAFEEFRRQFVVQIASQYFRLLTQQQAITNRRVSYIISVQTYERSLAIYAAGRQGANFLAVQRAQQQVFTNENNIVTAENQYAAALDDFKITIGMPVEQAMTVVAVELDVVPPDLEAEVTTLALKYRLDLQTSADRIEDARRSVSNAKNSLLADVDLRFDASVGNRDGDPGVDVSDRTFSGLVGVDVDFPVDRVAERNAYRRTLINLERSQRSWQELRDNIVAQVRDASRAIRLARATLDIQQRSIDLAVRQLDYANELLVLGRSTDNRDAVDAQNNLLNAQDRYDQARANYQIQILSFLRDTGTLRLDPTAGTLAAVMDRAALRASSQSLGLPPTTMPNP